VTDERLLRAEELAERLSVPTTWIREHTRSGAIPCVRLGRWVRYSTADVDDWLENLKSGGQPTFRKYHPRRRV